MKPTAAIAALVAVSSMILLVTAAHSKSPPGTLTIVTASQGGLMTDSGPLNPHAYRPNEFVVSAGYNACHHRHPSYQSFASCAERYCLRPSQLQDMLYEGLVHYGEDGKLVPALAESWVYKPGGAGSPPTINFNLRK